MLRLSYEVQSHYQPQENGSSHFAVSETLYQRAKGNYAVLFSSKYAYHLFH